MLILASQQRCYWPRMFSWVIVGIPQCPPLSLHKIISQRSGCLNITPWWVISHGAMCLCYTLADHLSHSRVSVMDHVSQIRVSIHYILKDNFLHIRVSEYYTLKDNFLQIRVSEHYTLKDHLCLPCTKNRICTWTEKLWKVHLKVQHVVTTQSQGDIW